MPVPPVNRQQLIRFIFKGALHTFGSKFYSILNDSKQCLGYVLPAKHVSVDVNVIPRYHKPLMHVHKVQITNLDDASKIIGILMHHKNGSS